MKRILFAALLLTLPLSTAQAASDISELDWQVGGGSHFISGMGAAYTTRADEALVRGRDAADFSSLTQGHDFNPPDVVIYRTEGPLADSWIELIYNETGYLTTDDWDEYIDADAILQSIREGTEESNKVLAEGYPTLTIDGWVEEPFLDREQGIVYWAIALHDSEGSAGVNATAMKLGRKGYVEILWVGGAEQFQSARETLKPSISALNYKVGARYVDFEPGIDAVAAVGVGALAYTMMTGSDKASKGMLAGAIAVVVAFFKKAWFVLFLPFVFLWRKFTGKRGE